MALIDKASLLMVPSTYEAGTLYNVLPSGNRAPDSTDQNSGYDQTRADFDFDRGSNASATRVNASGLIEKYRENLLLQSNAFSTSPWNTNLVTATSGQSGYDGNTNAWKIDLTGATGNLAVGGLSVGNVGTYSVYAKAGTLNWILLGSQSGNIQAYINLSDGSIGTTGVLVIEAKTEDVGGGWYRCSMTYSGTATVARVYPAQANGNLTATSGNIYIQSAQLESGLVATDYLESTSVTGKAGVLVDLPRINYDANGENGALLLEPSRANKTEHAEYFEGWSRVNTGVAILDANAYTSPEGLQNAYKVTFTEGGGQSQIYKVLSGFTIGTKYTQSLYVKYISGSGENFQIVKSFGTAGVRCTFTNGGADLSVIAVGGTQANDFGKEPLGNGWFRIWFTYASNTTNWEINISRNSGTGSDVYAIYGHQIEEGNYVSSYIPTMGTSETRAADSCSVDYANAHPNDEGTIFFEVGNYDTNTTASGFNKILVLSEAANTSLDNVIYFEEYAGKNTILIRKGGSTLLQSTPAYQDLRGSKIAIKWNSSEAKFFIDGSLNNTYTGDASLSPRYIGYDNPYNGQIVSSLAIKQQCHFNEALTDAECVTLTTL